MAFVIDLIIVGAALTFISIFLGIISADLIGLNILVFMFYTLSMELLFSGQTPGKMALKIKVIKLDGTEPSPLDFLIRWTFRIVDIWFSIGGMAVVFISTSLRSQRLGGVLSNTMVVQLGGESNLALRDILKIEDRSKYTPEYRDVIRFSEEEMLTVKSVLDRYATYRNPAHLALIEETSRRCAQVLEISDIPKNRNEFLRTLIRDYIVLTRS